MPRTILSYLTIVILLSLAACALGSSPELAYGKKIQATIDQLMMQHELYGEVMTDPSKSQAEKRLAGEILAVYIDKLIGEAANLMPPASCEECIAIQTELQKALPVPHNRPINWSTIQSKITEMEYKYGQIND